MISDPEIEAEIQAKNLTAPRVTLDMILQSIEEESYFHIPGTTITICVLTLKNGYTLTGQSACVDPANYNEELGNKIARQKAIDSAWALFGFQLASELSHFYLT